MTAKFVIADKRLRKKDHVSKSPSWFGAAKIGRLWTTENSEPVNRGLLSNFKSFLR